MKKIVVVALASCALVACGPRPKPISDGGSDTDDSGVATPDAGWAQGTDPASGWQVVAELPATAAASTHLGVYVTSTGDAFGQPLIAAQHEDPNGDLNYDDNKIVFTRWNGTDKKFTELRTVEVVGGAVYEHPNRQISIARDAMSNRIAIAYVKPQDNTVRVAISDDDGANFSLSTASEAGDTNSNPSIALQGGVAHLAWKQGTALKYKKRTGDGAWVDQSPSGLQLGAQSVSLAVDAMGKAGVAFFVANGATSSDLAFWRPGTDMAYPIASANMIDQTVSSDRRPSVSLTIVDTTPHVAFHLRNVEPLVTADNTPELFYAKATDATGNTWAPAVAIPRNGSATVFHTTAWYQALNLDASGRVNVAAAFTTHGAQTNCGGPKLARSPDGLVFMTCSPASSPVQTAGAWLSMWPHRAGKQTMVFAYDEFGGNGSRANPNLKPGIVMWREP